MSEPEPSGLAPVGDGPPVFGIEFTIRVDRLRKRRCRGCGRRRIVFALRGSVGNAVVASSPFLCGGCAGLHP